MDDTNCNIIVFVLNKRDISTSNIIALIFVIKWEKRSSIIHNGFL